jgi:hypothetical protein
MAADWMASGFAFEPGDVDQLASDVLNRTAWNGWRSGALPLTLLEGRQPRPAQIGTLELALDEQFAVIEAPTGTGKTEAALIWASRLARPVRSMDSTLRFPQGQRRQSFMHVLAA